MPIVDVLRNKAHSLEVPKARERKRKWLESLDQLYKEIDAWMEPAVKEGSVSKLAVEETQIVEELLGAYQAPMRLFQVGPSILRLEPRGTYIIGAAGRINIEGPAGMVKLVLDPTDYKTWHRVGSTPDELLPFDEKEFEKILNEVLS